MPRLFLLSAIFVLSVLALGVKFIPYFSFYKDGGKNPSYRIFLASNYEGPPNVDSTSKGEEQINRERRELILGKLNSTGFDRENVVILEEPSPVSPQFGEGSVNVLKMSAEKITIETDSQQPKLLFLRKNYFPLWRAKVDGAETKIYRANYSFMAVPMIGGAHKVEIFYDNRPFYILGLIAVIGLVSLFAVSPARSRRKG